MNRCAVYIIDIIQYIFMKGFLYIYFCRNEIDYFSTRDFQLVFLGITNRKAALMFRWLNCLSKDDFRLVLDG